MSGDPVSAVDEPTIEQMENVAATLGLGSIVVARSLPHYEQSLRNLHALAVKMLNGDEQASRAFEAMRQAFGGEA